MEAGKKTETSTAIIWLDRERILHLRIKDGALVSLDEAKKYFEIYETLGCGNNKVPQLIEGSAFFTFSTDALKYASLHGKHFFIAAAIVNTSLSTRLLFNFFNKFLKQEVPFRMFGNREKALVWLRSFIK